MRFYRLIDNIPALMMESMVSITVEQTNTNINSISLMSLVTW